MLSRTTIQLSIQYEAFKQSCITTQALATHLLYIRTSGFHSLEGGILISSILPYSDLFHFILISLHSWNHSNIRPCVWYFCFVSNFYVFHRTTAKHVGKTRIDKLTLFYMHDNILLNKRYIIKQEFMITKSDFRIQ